MVVAVGDDCVDFVFVVGSGGQTVVGDVLRPRSFLIGVALVVCMQKLLPPPAIGVREDIRVFVSVSEAKGPGPNRGSIGRVLGLVRV